VDQPVGGQNTPPLSDERQMLLNKLSILAYHRVLPEPDPMRPGEVDAQVFERHMKYVSLMFRVVSLPSAVQDLREGRVKRGAVAITFDDGYADNASVALPILKRLGLTATFFVASGYLNGGRMWNDTVTEAVYRHSHNDLDLSDMGLTVYATGTVNEKSAAAQAILTSLKYLPQNVRDSIARTIAARVANELPDNLMMTEAQVRELSDNDMTVGGHTVSHPILSMIDDDAAFREIDENQKVLQEITARPVDLFAYPNGKANVDYTDRHVEILKSLEFKAAVSTEWGTVSKSSDPYQMPRFTPWDRFTGKYMLRLLERRWRYG